MEVSNRNTEDDAAGTGLKRIRKGTRSCTECRRRKIRCLWDSEADTICTCCKAKGRHCSPQLYTRRTRNSTKASSRDRIARLEAQLANITAAVHDRSPVRTSYQHDEGRQSTSPAFEDHDSDTDDPTMNEGPQPPEHLRFLFDNALIGPDERANNIHKDRVAPPVCSARYKNLARARLQKIMPSRADVAAVSSYAVSWMSLYYELFPPISVMPDRDEMVNKHEDVLKPDADPVQITSFLLTFAITARQIPQSEQSIFPRGWKDVDTYVKAVMTTVDAVIISHAGIASTVEGLAVAVLYLRLQLGLGQVRALWLTLRRTVALAELSGLTRIWCATQSLSARTSGQNDLLRANAADKIALWEGICAVDRLASMMFNLPAATATCKFPRREVIDSDGNVNVRAYMFEQAGIAMRISELDDGYISGRSPTDNYEAVLAGDQDLRRLKALTPVSWWQESAEYLSSALLVQYWQYYLTARLHLHPSMAIDEHDQYAYSRTTCLNACSAIARRYSHIRRALPAGFFVCRIVDMQAFTAAVYLTLSSYSPDLESSQDDSGRVTSVEQIVTTMEFVSRQVGAEFAQEAAATLRALVTHLGSPNAPGLTLRVPLLGSIHVGRRTKHAALSSRAASTRMPSHGDTMRSGTADSSHQPSMGPTTLDGHYPAANYQPWMQLDVNSSFQDPFVAGNLGDFDQWMGLSNITPMIGDIEMYNEAMGSI